VVPAQARPRTQQALAAFIGLWALALAGCADTGPAAVPVTAQQALPTPERRTRVVMVGIDGADWDNLDPLIDAGGLDNLAHMRHDAAWAPLHIDSAESPESWTTIATGVHPDQHGIIEDKQGRGGVFFATPDMLKRHRLWDIATRFDRSSLVSGWWVTGPAYPIKGVMIGREDNSSFPAGALDVGGADLRPAHEAAQLDRLGLGLVHSGVVRTWTGRQDFDLIALPYYGHDQALHMLYAEHAAARDPALVAGLPPDLAENVRTADAIVKETVALADRLVGVARQLAGDDGYVVLFSDHGHSLAPHPERRIALARRVLDGARGTIEHGRVQLDGATLSLDVDIEHPDLPPPLAYDLRMPRIFVEGDPDGAVRNKLLALKTAAGDPLLSPYGTALRPSAAVQQACQRAIGRKVEPAWTCFVNTGAHDLDDLGIFAVSGPGVRAGRVRSDVATVDIAPTVLWLMGLPYADDMVGRPLTVLLSDPPRPTSVRSYEDGRQPWKAAAPSVQDPVEVQEWLKSMGYIQ